MKLCFDRDNAGNCSYHRFDEGSLFPSLLLSLGSLTARLNRAEEQVQLPAFFLLAFFFPSLFISLSLSLVSFFLFLYHLRSQTIPRLSVASATRRPLLFSLFDIIIELFALTKHRPERREKFGEGEGYYCFFIEESRFQDRLNAQEARGKGVEQPAGG